MADHYRQDAGFLWQGERFINQGASPDLFVVPDDQGNRFLAAVNQNVYAILR